LATARRLTPHARAGRHGRADQRPLLELQARPDAVPEGAGRGPPRGHGRGPAGAGRLGLRVVHVDEHNRRLVRALQDDGRLYVTGAMVDGQWCLRPCLVNFRTTVEDAHALVDIARETGRRIESA